MQNLFLIMRYFLIFLISCFNQSSFGNSDVITIAQSTKLLKESTILYDNLPGIYQDEEEDIFETIDDKNVLTKDYTSEQEASIEAHDLKNNTTNIATSNENDQLLLVSKGVKLIALNKITAHAKELIIRGSGSRFFGNMEIILHKCVKVNNPYRPDNQVLLTLIDHRPEEDASVIYQGWMLSSSMSACNFENPIYEIFVKECL